MREPLEKYILGNESELYNKITKNIYDKLSLKNPWEFSHQFFIKSFLEEDRITFVYGSEDCLLNCLKDCKNQNCINFIDLIITYKYDKYCNFIYDVQFIMGGRKSNRKRILECLLDFFDYCFNTFKYEKIKMVLIDIPSSIVNTILSQLPISVITLEKELLTLNGLIVDRYDINLSKKIYSSIEKLFLAEEKEN